MPDVRSLIETAQKRGLNLFLAGARVKVQAPQDLDGETKALLEELREHREEIRSILAHAGPPCWNCNSITTEAEDIYRKPVWVCWACARWV